MRLGDVVYYTPTTIKYQTEENFMATKKQTAPLAEQTPILNTPVTSPLLVAAKSKKKVSKKKPAAKKVVAKKPTPRAPVTAKKKITKKKAGKKKPVATVVAEKKQEPIIAVERVTVYSENSGLHGRFTLVHVGELYLAAIFFALVILGVTYWAVALSNTVQWAQTLTSSSEYVVEHVMRLALL